MDDTNLRSCAFILTIEHSLATLVRVTELLSKKLIEVDSLNYHIMQNGEGRITIFCALHKDKIGYIGRHFEELEGVKMVDWMNARSRIKYFS